ncbi:MAG: hypothetical protein WCJ61_08550 [Paludibacter sp.]
MAICNYGVPSNHSLLAAGYFLVDTWHFGVSPSQWGVGEDY